MPKHFCKNNNLIKVFGNTVENSSKQFLCFNHPISGFQARKPNRIGCKKEQKKSKKKYRVIYCKKCCKLVSVKKVNERFETNKMGFNARLDFEHDRIYNSFSMPNVESDRRSRKRRPGFCHSCNLTPRYNSKDLCPGLCPKCMKHYRYRGH